MTERGVVVAMTDVGCGAVDDLRPPHVMASAQDVGAISSVLESMHAGADGRYDGCFCMVCHAPTK